MVSLSQEVAPAVIFSWLCHCVGAYLPVGGHPRISTRRRQSRVATSPLANELPLQPRHQRPRRHHGPRVSPPLRRRHSLPQQQRGSTPNPSPSAARLRHTASLPVVSEESRLAGNKAPATPPSPCNGNFVLDQRACVRAQDSEPPVRRAAWMAIPNALP